LEEGRSPDHKIIKAEKERINVGFSSAQRRQSRVRSSLNETEIEKGEETSGLASVYKDRSISSIDGQTTQSGAAVDGHFPKET